MRYAFIKGHQLQFTIRTMCRMLCVHPSGFYAWLKRPFSKRAAEDDRQTELLKEAWEDSGKVYGYRKLHDDMRDLLSKPRGEVGKTGWDQGAYWL